MAQTWLPGAKVRVLLPNAIIAWGEIVRDGDPLDYPDDMQEGIKSAGLRSAFLRGVSEVAVIAIGTYRSDYFLWAYRVGDQWISTRGAITIDDMPISAAAARR